MNIYLKDQVDNFVGLHDKLKSKPTMLFDKSKLREKTTTIDIRTEKLFQDINMDFLFDYNIFPPHIMTYLTEWGKENREMRVGDTILQQAFIPPTKLFSQKIIFGVRIKRIINETDKRGFSYETIEGHVERGESIFTIEKGDVGYIFKIKTYSEPGNLLTRLVGPIFTVPYQTYCTRAALKNVKRQIEGQQ